MLLSRGRALCLLKITYDVLRGRGNNDVVLVGGRLRDELFSLVVLAPLFSADLRATEPDALYLTDASVACRAVVSAQIAPALGAVLWRRATRRGKWSRLLRGAKSLAL